jgi:hypothetical protein
MLRDFDNLEFPPGAIAKDDAQLNLRMNDYATFISMSNTIQLFQGDPVLPQLSLFLDRNLSRK